MDHQTNLSLSSQETESTAGTPVEDPASKTKAAAPVDRQSLLVLIKEQLEFYFSEDNLPRDVFLLKQIEKDKTKEGYVSLKVIAGFPKMKRLTHDLGAIREAAEISDLVVLSPDGLSVKRKIPLVLPEDTTEKRTLYVTRLPKDCDRESLMLVFSEYGTVVRLDLPMDKKTGEHKGMAFVEFQAEEELRKALEDFTTSNKYKMVVKPFKSRNSKDPSISEKTADSTSEKDDEEKESPDSNNNKEKRSSGGKTRNSKDISGEQVRRNSQDLKDTNGEKRKSGDGSTNVKQNTTKELKRNSKDESETKRKSGDGKSSFDSSKDKRFSKDAREYAKQQSNRPNSKEPKRTSKEKDQLSTGREVPQIPDSYDNTFNQSRARGAKTQRNSDKMKEDDDEKPTRPSSFERSKFKKEFDVEKPQFVPVRNPYGPTAEGRGFGLGRGKLMVR